MLRTSAMIAVTLLSIWASISYAEEPTPSMADNEIRLMLSVIDTTIDKTAAVSLLDLSQHWITATSLASSASDEGRRLLTAFPATLRDHANNERVKGEEAKAIIYSAFADYVSASMPKMDGVQHPSQQTKIEASQPPAKVEPPSQPQPPQVKVEPHPKTVPSQVTAELPIPPLPPAEPPPPRSAKRTTEATASTPIRAPKRATEETANAPLEVPNAIGDNQQRWSGYDTQEEEIYARFLRKLKTRHPEMQQQ